jgi:hypothetical protein
MRKRDCKRVDLKRHLCEVIFDILWQAPARFDGPNDRQLKEIYEWLHRSSA